MINSNQGMRFPSETLEEEHKIRAKSTGMEEEVNDSNDSFQGNSGNFQQFSLAQKAFEGIEPGAIISSNLELKMLVHETSFTKVFLGELLNEDKKIEKTAVKLTVKGKVLENSCCSFGFSYREKQKKKVFWRMKNSLNWRDPKLPIPKYFSFLKTETLKIEVMEAAEYGSLYSFLSENQETIDAGLFLSITRQILNAIFFLINKKIYYLSIDPTNILIQKDSSFPKGIKVLLSSFKHSEVFLDKKDSIDPFGWLDLTTFTPPEMFRNKEDFNPVKADIWSLGSLMYYMLMRREIPYDQFCRQKSSEVVEIVLNDLLPILNRQLPAENSNFLVGIMEECLKSDPNERIGLERLIKKLERLDKLVNVATKNGTPSPKQEMMEERSPLSPNEESWPHPDSHLAIDNAHIEHGEEPKPSERFHSFDIRDPIGPWKRRLEENQKLELKLLHSRIADSERKLQAMINTEMHGFLFPPGAFESEKKQNESLKREIVGIVFENTKDWMDERLKSLNKGMEYVRTISSFFELSQAQESLNLTNSKKQAIQAFKQILSQVLENFQKLLEDVSWFFGDEIFYWIEESLAFTRVVQAMIRELADHRRKIFEFRRNSIGKSGNFPRGNKGPGRGRTKTAQKSKMHLVLVGALYLLETCKTLTRELSFFMRTGGLSLNGKISIPTQCEFSQKGNGSFEARMFLEKHLLHLLPF